MSKRTIIIVLAAVLICAIGFGGVKYMENTVESSVLTSLQKQQISAESVSYNVIDNILEIHALRGPSPILDSGSFSINHIKIIQPNLDALDPAIAGSPLVAEEVIFSDLQAKHTYQGDTYTSSIQSMRVFGWKQNMGKVFAALEQKDMLALAAASLEAYATSVEVQDVHNKNTFMGTTIETSIKSYTIKDLSPKVVGSYLMQGIQSRSTDPNNIRTLSTIDSMEIRSLDMPSPAFMTYIWETVFSGGKNIDPTQSILQKHIHDHFATEIDASFSLKGFAIAYGEIEKEEELGSIDNMSFTINYDAVKATNLTFAINMDKIMLHYAKIGFMDLEPLLDSPTLTLSTSLKSAIHPNPHASNLAVELGVENLADTKLSMDVILPVDTFSSFFTSGFSAVQQILTQLQIKKVDLSLADTGILPRKLIEISKRVALPLEQTYDVVKNEVEKEFRFLQTFLTEENQNNLMQCIFTPGTLNTSLELQEPTALMAVSLQAMSNPRSLPVKITCQAGVSVLEKAKKLMQP